MANIIREILLKKLTFFASIIVLISLSNVGDMQAQNLSIKSGKVLILTQPAGMDEKICKAGTKKAQELKLNPICIFLNDSGTISFEEGTLVSIENGRYVFNNGDMVINAGNKPIEVQNIMLQEGKYAIIKNGKIEKQGIISH